MVQNAGRIRRILHKATGRAGRRYWVKIDASSRENMEFMMAPLPCPKRALYSILDLEYALYFMRRSAVVGIHRITGGMERREKKAGSYYYPYQGRSGNSSAWSSRSILPVSDRNLRFLATRDEAAYPTCEDCWRTKLM